MATATKPWWQQATALVSLSAGGAITGFTFVPKAAADLTSPASMPLSLLALQQTTRPSATNDAALRSAIVKVAEYYRQMAQDKTPAKMEAIIWQHDSTDGADHGESCAAFASMTLELAAQVVGQQSWVTGGSSYPWPLHSWADVRVNPNQASLGIVSIQQDAQGHGRWHPVGSGYQPVPGDWVLFDGHVEVVTRYSRRGPVHDRRRLHAQLLGQRARVPCAAGRTGVPVSLTMACSRPPGRPPLARAAGAGPGTAPPAPPPAAVRQARPPHSPAGQAQAQPGVAAIPGTSADAPAAAAAQAIPAQAARPSRACAGSGPPSPALQAGLPPAQQPHARAAGAAAGPTGKRQPAAGRAARRHQVQVPTRGGAASTPRAAAPTPAVTPSAGAIAAAQAPASGAVGTLGAAAIPGLEVVGDPANPAAAPGPAPAQQASPEEAFINEVSPGAVAAQHAYRVPAAVTIAQAIVESGWGQSGLATKDHNLFGIKGTARPALTRCPPRNTRTGSQ